VDEQVKIRGHRLELREVEYAVALATGLRQVIVRAEDGALVAYLIGPGASELQMPTLRDRLAQDLPRHMCPSRYFALAAPPLNEHGKLDLSRLSTVEHRELGSVRYVAPATATEQLLAQLWAEVLGLEVERVGVEDMFLDLGGTSLLAAKLVTRINGQLGLVLTVRKIFEQPTIAGLAGLCDGEAGVMAFGTI
jgi:hypothetical protein